MTAQTFNNGQTLLAIRTILNDNAAQINGKLTNGTGAPTDGVTGIDGGYYIDEASGAWYGPRTDGAWGAAFYTPSTTAASVSYSNATSGIPENEVQGAIDNVEGRVDVLESTPVVLGSVDKTFLENEVYDFTLPVTVNSPDIAVTKEVPQIGVTSNRWNMSSVDSYDRENYAPSTSLTPSATTGIITLTLGVGDLTGLDGSLIYINGGVVQVTGATSGNVLTALDNTNIANSGEWQLYKMEVGEVLGSPVIKISGVSFSFEVSAAFNDQTENFSNNNFNYVTKDGLHVYGANLANHNHHTLTNAWDLTAKTLVDNVAKSGGFAITDVTPDGTRALVYDFGTTRELTLDGNPFELASRTVTGSNVAGDSGQYNNDGSVVYTISGGDFKAYPLSTPYILSTAGAASTIDLPGITLASSCFSPNYDYIVTVDTVKVIRVYSLAVAGDISSGLTLVSTQSGIDVSNSQGPISTDTDGNYMFTSLAQGTPVPLRRYAISANNSFADEYIAAVTNISAQIDTDFWTAFTAISIGETLRTKTAYYAYSTDGKTTFKVALSGSGERSIARNNGGTWEYNSNATYGSETWVAASTNDQFNALKDAAAVAANQMDSTQVQAAEAEVVIASTFDFAIILRTDNEDVLPQVDSVSLTYDANALNEGAILGTDYRYDQPTANQIRFESLAAQNLKIRVS